MITPTYNSEKENFFDLTFKMFTALGPDDFEYIYRGEFSSSVSTDILSLAETNISATTGYKSLKKRIYFLMVEGLQNITKHAEQKEKTVGSGIFAIQKKEDRYIMTTGNVIKKEDGIRLKSKLEQINLLDKTDLKKLRQEILQSGSLSEKSGAGLGLIEIARKSGTKLKFYFDPIDENYSFFYLRSEITSIKGQELEESEHDNKSAASKLRSFENKFKQENILFSFNGDYNRETVINLVAVLEAQDIIKSSKKIYGLLVEMVQNISKHTAYLSATSLKSKGVFMLSYKNDRFILTTGNYISNSEFEELESRITRLNEMSEEQLEKAYNKILFGDDSYTDDKTTGLGFINMRLKSQNKITLISKPVDDLYHFVVIQIMVDN